MMLMDAKYNNNNNSGSGGSAGQNENSGIALPSATRKLSGQDNAQENDLEADHCNGMND